MLTLEKSETKSRLETAYQGVQKRMKEEKNVAWNFLQLSKLKVSTNIDVKISFPCQRCPYNYYQTNEKISIFSLLHLMINLWRSAIYKGQYVVQIKIEKSYIVYTVENETVLFMF